jgi:hypothetical protein
MPLIPQPQDKILNKTKRLPFLLKKEHPRIPRVVIHHTRMYHFPLADRTPAGPTRSILSSSHGHSVITSVRGG